MSRIDKKQAILDTALTLFVSQGFYATSTASIAKKAGVATGTLFHHFPSKEALINHLYLSIKQEFADAIQSKISQKGELKTDAQNLWQVAINWAMENPLKQEFFQQYSMSPSIASEVRLQAMNSILGFMGQLIKQGQKAGVLADYPLSLMLESCHGQYLAATRYFIDNPTSWKDEEYKRSSFAMFWNAMKA
ncbi:TetR/AcrR family transcriptional regulator [Shewanella schlegeliana]|uniref:TetR/AcrR family transcriptional regulator n=1 Tax=Shewanella schlegeliana TaxID=190308 RepID=A0ABS1T2Q8_9GAMM|nr:TetR/AcrR family transcriptional regulator [Shewanella schlegeliana]MBL4914419.1 TetR/AcrR family transcriptional regulator [Shewanella schlegeliana]MCL1109357.1 TetR/AcrR family transcriptional regulator [Shewanella schlegeliana]GIU31724.1 TetR family transcriptional regulator [Shewanella schlegeliana]